MKFQIVLSAFAALALAQDATSSAAPSQTSAAPTPTPTPVLTPEAKCLIDNNCGDNLDCASKCLSVPNPNADWINKTTTCVANCDQSNAEKYGQCTQQCIQGNFFNYPNAENVNPPQKDGNGTNNATNKSSTSSKQSGGSSNAYKLVPALTFTVLGLSFFLLSL